MYIPYKDMLKSARVLMTHDLYRTIQWARNSIINSIGIFEDGTLARYGLILSNEYKIRTGKTPAKQTFWIAFLGNDEWPDFMEPYYKNHRSLLVLLGWLRNLKDEDLMEIVRYCEPRELESKLRLLSKDPDNREYSQFDERPGAYELWPRS